jgi:HEAT repeat protein
VTKLLGLFLGHEDPDAVAAAIEAIVEIGDPTARPKLERLANDTRTVELAEDDDEEPSEVTIGELASEALALLEPLGGEDPGVPDTPRRGGGS